MKRSCKRNKRKMYYALYTDKIPVLDEEGNDTFTFTTGYENPVEFYASLSAGKGSAESSEVGIEVFHNREIVTDDMSLPIQETSIIWVGKEPVYNEDGTVDDSSANYRVNAPILDGLNNLRISVESNSEKVAK